MSSLSKLVKASWIAFATLTGLASALDANKEVTRLKVDLDEAGLEISLDNSRETAFIRIWESNRDVSGPL